MLHREAAAVSRSRWARKMGVWVVLVYSRAAASRSGRDVRYGMCLIGNSYKRYRYTLYKKYLILYILLIKRLGGQNENRKTNSIYSR